MTINTACAVGQYVGVQADSTKVVAGVSYRVIVYGAYNALGLIGSECNGIAVLNETDCNVVLDEDTKESSGYFGASERQMRRWKEIMEMDESAFVAFVNGHKRARYEI